ncbi:hypothetical protein B0H21DRAFT_722208 [Amylocystis lapponica]|nr:hypothetical protein B0H21DRAFT_722208 [Amylocystis lapponica]
MPFTDVVNTRDTALSKRAHDDFEDPVSSKRTRLAPTDSPERDQAASGSGPRTAVDPYSVPPAPSADYVQLRLQLCRFKGVYRVVQLPLSATLAHLYRFVLFAFGWSGMHSHRSDVCTNAMLYSVNWRKGEIKKFGARPPPEPDRDTERDEWFDWMTVWGRGEERPALRVVPCGDKRRKRPWWDDEQVPEKEDDEVTLGDVWSASGRKRDNASKGECPNENIGIKLQYDLGSSWDVHITIEGNKNRVYMFEYDPPANTPFVIAAKGAPPCEDVHHDLPGEWEARDKKVSPLLFSSNSFGKYLAGELGSEARKTELAIFNYEGEYARRQEARKARREAKEQLRREIEENLAAEKRKKRGNDEQQDDGEESESTDDGEDAEGSEDDREDGGGESDEGTSDEDDDNSAYE